MERFTSDSERVVWTLIGTGGVTVERNGEIVNTKFGHLLHGDILVFERGNCAGTSTW
jgi:hypothetical protein